MRKLKICSFFSLWLPIIACTLMACSSQPKNVKTIDSYPVIYPDYVEVTIPVDIAPLNFSMANDSITTIDVKVKGSKGGSLYVNGEYADFNIDEWQQIVKQNKGGKLIVTVCAKKDGQWTQYRDFNIYISNYPLDEWGITYRRIAPGYEMYGRMGIYQRCLTNFEETPLIDNDLCASIAIQPTAPILTNMFSMYVEKMEARSSIAHHYPLKYFKPKTTRSVERWSIHIGIPTNAIALSLPTRPRRCFTPQTTSA